MVCRSVCHNSLKGREFTLLCSYGWTCFQVSLPEYQLVEIGAAELSYYHQDIVELVPSLHEVAGLVGCSHRLDPLLRLAGQGGLPSGVCTRRLEKHKVFDLVEVVHQLDPPGLQLRLAQVGLVARRRRRSGQPLRLWDLQGAAAADIDHLGLVEPRRRTGTANLDDDAFTRS